MTKYYRTLLASLCMAALSCGASAQNKTIAIGYHAPLSGENAQYGAFFLLSINSTSRAAFPA